MNSRLAEEFHGEMLEKSLSNSKQKAESVAYCLGVELLVGISFCYAFAKFSGGNTR
jgi:hypothetical protein